MHPRFAGLCATIVVAAALAPKWPVTWSLAESTIIQPCNTSGFLDAAFFSQFAVVDVDWSNAKQLWVVPPMSCEELLIEQCGAFGFIGTRQYKMGIVDAHAAILKAANPSLRCFVYRNLVKALPWYSSVREVVNDPTRSGWFLSFANTTGPFHVPMCDASWNPPRCSAYYHDNDQTPGFPHGDGDCPGPCDCGGVPCGEYVWNHLNGTLRSWFINEYILGQAGLGNANVSGFFLDDAWFNTPEPVKNWMPQPHGFCSCGPIGGPTEEDYHCVDDMGLVQENTTALTSAWSTTMDVVQQVIVGAGAWAWQYFTSASTPSRSECASAIRSACSQGADWELYQAGIQFGWTTSNGTSPLPQPAFDIAIFQLLRGPHWWIGYGWAGCDVKYDFPDGLRADYGVPISTCSEVSPGSGVFTRAWSKANVTADCNTYSSETVFL